MEIINTTYNKNYSYSRKRWAIFDFDDNIVKIFLIKGEAIKELLNYYNIGCYISEIWL